MIIKTELIQAIKEAKSCFKATFIDEFLERLVAFKKDLISHKKLAEFCMEVEDIAAFVDLVEKLSMI